MENFYGDDSAGLQSFTDSELALLKTHENIRKISLWFEGASAPDLDFLLDCPCLETVYIYGGKIDDYSALTKLPALRDLAINGKSRKWLENLDFINGIHSLEKLEISHLPRLVEFPWLGDCVLLEHVKIRGCKQLTDISNVSSIPNLKSFGIVGTPVSVEEFEFIAQKPGMEKMSAAFGSKKKDDLFQALLDKYGLSFG